MQTSLEHSQARTISFREDRSDAIFCLSDVRALQSRVTKLRVVRGLAVVAALIFIAPALHAQADFTFKFEPRAMGSASVYGYALWTTQLGSVLLNSYTIPIRADFNTDPRPAPTPSPLGAGWSIPLVSSALVEESQGGLRWHRPDGRIFTFMLQRGLTGKSEKSLDKEYISMDSAWTAVKEAKSRYYTLTHIATGAELIYEEGLLVRFSFVRPSDGGERYTITYNHMRRPVRLSVVNSGKVLAEFIYENAYRAKKLQLGGAGESSSKTLIFEYQNAKLNYFREGPYLAKINSEETPTALDAQYTTITYQSDTADTNSIRFECDKSNDRTILVWISVSGFLSKDDGATYKVENPSLADQGRPVVTAKPAEKGKAAKSSATFVDYNWYPDDAKITRTEGDGKSEFRYYDRAKGVYTRTNKEGISLVTYYLLSPGPMNGKIRKIEEVRGKEIKTIERNAYDEIGRLTRKITPEYTALTEYTGTSIRKFINGSLTEESSVNGGTEVIKKYTPLGIVETIHTEGGDETTDEEKLNGVTVMKKIIKTDSIVLTKGLIETRFVPNALNPFLYDIQQKSP